MKIVLTGVVLLGWVAFRFVQLLAGIAGLASELGVIWAVLGVACLLLLRLTAPIRIGAFLYAFMAWHWPWYAALIFAAPRAVLMLPGLISTWIAHLRHPPPRWPRADALSVANRRG